MHFLKNIAVLITLLSSIGCAAQQRFQEYIYDVANPYNFECHQLNTTSDSGFIFNGFINNFGGFLLKTHKDGTVYWSKTYAGLNNIYDAEQTPDHGFITIGDNALGKTMLMKVDSFGNVQWTKARTAINAPGGCVHVMPDGGYVFAGLSNVFIIRTDAAGTILWEKTYSFHSEATNGRFLQPTPDGGFIICATTYQPGGIGLVKLDSLGNIQWEKSISPGDQRGVSVCVAGSGYFLTTQGISEHLAMLTDSMGNVLWAKQWPVNYDTINSISEPPFLVVPGGNELVCYGTRFFPNQNKTHIFRFDTAGNVMWSRYYGTSQTDYAESPGSCVRTYGNGLAFTIRLSLTSGIFVLSLDSTGMADCNSNTAAFSPTPFAVTYGTSSLLVQSPGIAYNSPALNDAPRMSYLQYECTPLSIDPLFTNENMEAYPNPANEKITLQFPSNATNGTLTILDLSGRMVDKAVLTNGEKIEMNTVLFSPGVYLWKYTANGNVRTGKFCVQH